MGEHAAQGDDMKQHLPQVAKSLSTPRGKVSPMCVAARLLEEEVGWIER